MLKKVNSTIITLGIAGVLAIAVGFYVNSVNWKPVGEETKSAGTDETSSTGDTASTPSYPTWAASATGRVEPKSGEVHVTSEVRGRIEDVAVDVNDRVKAGDLLVRLDDDLALTKVASPTADANVRERERNNDNVRGLADERRDAEDAVATAERTLFGARQAFDDALKEKRAGNGSDEAVATARSNLDEAKKKLADERANLASVNAKAGMPLPTRVEVGTCRRPREVVRGRARRGEDAHPCPRRWQRPQCDGQGRRAGGALARQPASGVRRSRRAKGARRGRGARRGQDPRRPDASSCAPTPSPTRISKAGSAPSRSRCRRPASPRAALAGPTTWRCWRP